MKKGHVPLRTCIGCRQKRPGQEMIRITAVGDTVAVSPRKSKLPGRGCYVCPTEKCVEAALRRNNLSRALRKNIAVLPSKEELLREIEQKG